MNTIKVKSNPFDSLKKQILMGKQQPFEKEVIEENNQRTPENVVIELPDIEPPLEVVEKDQSLSKLSYVFFPKQNITAYDLARVLALTQLMVTGDVYEKFPQDLQKFFIKFEDIPENINETNA